MSIHRKILEAIAEKEFTIKPEFQQPAPEDNLGKNLKKLLVGYGWKWKMLEPKTQAMQPAGVTWWTKTVGGWGEDDYTLRMSFEADENLYLLELFNPNGSAVGEQTVDEHTTIADVIRNIENLLKIPGAPKGQPKKSAWGGSVDLTGDVIDLIEKAGWLHVQFPYKPADKNNPVSILGVGLTAFIKSKLPAVLDDLDGIVWQSDGDIWSVWPSAEANYVEFENDIKWLVMKIQPDLIVKKNKGKVGQVGLAEVQSILETGGWTPVEHELEGTSMSDAEGIETQSVEYRNHDDFPGAYVIVRDVGSETADGEWVPNGTLWSVGVFWGGEDPILMGDELTSANVVAALGQLASDMGHGASEDDVKKVMAQKQADYVPGPIMPHMDIVNNLLKELGFKYEEKHTNSFPSGGSVMYQTTILYTAPDGATRFIFVTENDYVQSFRVYTVGDGLGPVAYEPNINLIKKKAQEYAK